jgi:hypothetical protein
MRLIDLSYYILTLEKNIIYGSTYRLTEVARKINYTLDCI